MVRYDMEILNVCRIRESA